MPNIFDRALFRTPKYSIFDQSKTNKLTFPIGKNIPVYWNELYAGDEIDVKLAQLTRFMPMLAPVMHRFAVDFIPAFVPFRLLQDAGWWDSEEFFNPATPDSSRPAVPMVTPTQLYSGADKIIGSVFDYLNYPTYTWVLQRLMQDKYPIANLNTTLHYADLFDLSSVSSSGYTVTIDSNLNITATIYMMAKYFVDKYPNNDWSSYYASGSVVDPTAFWDILYTQNGLKQNEAINEYVNYLHLTCVSALLSDSHFSGATPSLSLLPWLCYMKLMSDWFVNTNIQSADYESAVASVVTSLANSTMATALSSFISTIPDFLGLHPYLSSSLAFLYRADCCPSLWASDYFTSSFQNPQAGTAVPIPVNGTIQDLRNANRLQKALEKTLYAGKRLIDQIFVHRGVKSSDARMHRCEILGHKVFNLKVDDVLQTSQSTIDSTLADFAGFAASATGDHLCHYRAEEGGLLMIICRVRPRCEYMEATPKFILKSDFYDFENPDFDNVGMQPVLVNEIQYQGIGMTRVFGWNRRYSDYMFGLDEIHSDFKTSLDYWHAARMIDTQPTLNEEFITMNSDLDGYDRIFAVPGNKNNVLQYLRFDVAVSRPLSRYVQFSL